MEKNINHIIARVLSKEASTEDILLLSDWLNASQANKEEFKQLKYYWDAEVSFTNTIVPSLSFDTLSKEINQQKKSHKQTFKLKLWSSIAAAISVLLVISSLLMLYYEKDSLQKYTYLTNDNKTNFTLSDGTKIILNKNSTFTYSSTYGEKDRMIELTGEAYFEVYKNPESPFIVNMNGVSIKVLGTTFNVHTDNNNIIATLVDGSILFESLKQNVVLVPNQQLTYNLSTNQIAIEHVNTNVFTAWKDDLLKYKSIIFSNLISELEKIYKVKIRINNKKLVNPEVTVSGTFSQEQNIDQVLEIISRSLPFKWEKKNDVYYIR